MFKVLLHVSLLLCSISVLAQIAGQSALDAGDYDRARSEVTAAAKLNESSALNLMLGRINLAENKLDAAEELFSRVLEAEPDNALAHALQGRLFAIKASRASLFRSGKFAKRSVAALEVALEFDPELEEALIAMIHYRLSAPVLFGGSIDQAMNAAEKLQSINPVSGGLKLAEIYGKKKDRSRQISLLEDLAQSHVNDPRASLALGFMTQLQNEWDKASDYFKAAIQAGKNQPAHTYSIQSASYQVGRSAVLSKTDSNVKIHEGIEALSNYIEGPKFSDLPGLDWAHYRRGLLYARLGTKQLEAEHDFAIAATSNDRNLKRALGSL